MSNKQDIVPVKLTNSSNKNHNTATSRSKLVARLKYSSAELFLYDTISDHTLRSLIQELNTIDNH